jgi:putative DNA primase/helicase
MGVRGLTFTLEGFMQDLYAWLLNHGLDIKPILDGKHHRFSTENDKSGEKAGWYIGSVVMMPDGKEIVSLTVSDWRTDERLFFRTGGFKNGDLESYKKLTDKHAKALDAEKEEKWRQAAIEAKFIFEKCEKRADHPYAIRKKIAGELSIYDDKIVIPLYQKPGEICGLQFISEDGTKRFLPGTKKMGAFFIFHGESSKTIAICEGFATASSISQATGFTTFTAFDCGNLQRVGKKVRELYPDSKILITGDDDRFGEKEENAGRRAAELAAKECGGTAIFPEFNPEKRFTVRPEGIALEEPTDWCDLHLLEGLDEVKRQIENGLKRAESNEGSGEAHKDDKEIKNNIASVLQTQEHAGGDVGAGNKKNEAIKEAWDDKAIKFLGFIDGKHHYISKHSKKIVSLSPSQHTELNLLELMPLVYWDVKYSSLIVTEKGPKRLPIKWGHAANDLISSSLSSGYFESGRIRGSGIFKDGKDIVVNAGDKLLVNGTEMSHTEFDSSYIYIPGPKINTSVTAASVDDCWPLIDIGEMLLWHKKEEAKLFLGWIVCAILSGYLKWRPHLYITGVAGVGKSWVLENIVYPMTKQFSEYFLSNSSEAGIRQSIKSNALAVVWDEPEINNEADNRNIQKVLALARQSSFESDGRVSKGTASGNAMEFSIKSCFLLGSIKDAVQEGADLTRFTILSLTKIENPLEAKVHFKKLEKMVYDITDGDFPKRLAKMVYSRISDFDKNNTVIKNAIASKFNSRIAQQYGALLAGYALLYNSSFIDEKEAEELMKVMYDQENVQHHEAGEDLREVFEYLTAKMVVVDAADGNSGSVRMSVGEIMCKTELEDRLETYGMKVIHRDNEKHLFICYKHPELKNLFRDSKWVSGWGRSFGKIAGAKRTATRIAGALRRGVEIPIL